MLTQIMQVLGIMMSGGFKSPCNFEILMCPYYDELSMIVCYSILQSTISMLVYLLVDLVFPN